MNYFDLPNPRRNDIPNDEPRERNPSAPPLEEVNEADSGEFSEFDNVVGGVFLAGADGIEEGDTDPFDQDSGRTPEIPAEGTPDAPSGSEGGGSDGPPEDRLAPGEDEGDGEIARIQRDCLDNIDFYCRRLSLSRSPIGTSEERELNEAAIALASASLDDSVSVPFDNPTTPEKVAMHFAKIDAADSEDARNTLRDELHQEIYMEGPTVQIEADVLSQFALETHQSGPPTGWEAYRDAHAHPLLLATVEECIQRGESAKAWIETGVSGLSEDGQEAYRTMWLVRNYAHGATATNASPELKTEANAYVASLDTDSIADIGEPVIRAATDRSIKNTAAQDHVEATETNTRKLQEEGDLDTYERAKDLAASTVEIASDPLLDNDVMHNMRDALAHIHETAQQHPDYNEADASYFRSLHAEFDVKYMVGAGFPADLVASECKRYRRQGETLEPAAAATFMAAGKANDARIMAESCTSLRPGESDHFTRTNYKLTLQACWEKARTYEQMQQLEPRVSLLELDDADYMGKYHKYATAALSDDVATLAQHIQEAAAQPRDQHEEFTQYNPVTKMLERLAFLDLETAEMISYETLRGLSSHDESMNTLYNTQPYIDLLIEFSEKPEYLDCALEAIDNTSASLSRKILASAKLAKKIALRNRPGRNEQDSP